MTISHFIESISPLLPEGVFSNAPQHYLEEPRGRYKAPNAFLARPYSQNDIEVILREANRSKISIIPYGGGTGLVGGQVSETGNYLLLSLERMNKIGTPNLHDATLHVEAGAILENIHNACDAVEYRFPLSLASKGSSQIGGNLATNAGGINVIRFGNSRDLCLSLKGVLADGTAFEARKGLKKDNTGYDLNHLMIGSEGTLGVITEAILKIYPKPRARIVAFIEVASPTAAIDLLSLARTEFGDAIEAFELISDLGLSFVKECFPHLPMPFTTLPKYSVLMELAILADVEHFHSHVETTLAIALEKEIATDAYLAQSEAQAQQFWALREHIPLANRNIGAVSNHDISIPMTRLSEFLERAENAIQTIGAFRLGPFGHLGDGNLHYNIYPIKGRNRDDDAHHRSALKEAIHDLVNEMGGSISAEHGIGRVKTDDLAKYADYGKYKAMVAIKRALDPNNILNPGALFESALFESALFKND